MLLLKELKIKDFLSHTDTSIVFKPQQKLIITGKSGSGKSSIVGSILWSIFGQERSSSKFLIKKGAKQATVTLTLFDDLSKTYYKITRKIDEKNKHEIAVLEGKSIDTLKPIKTTGVRETQEFIETKIIHSSYLLFINSVLYPQNSAESFIYQTANKRKDIILEIAKTEDYDNYYKKAKELLSNDLLESQSVKATIREKELQINDGELDAILLKDYEAEDKKLGEDLVIINSKLSEFLLEKDAINRKVILINSNREKLEELSVSISNNDKRLGDLNNKIVELSRVDKEFLQKKVEELEGKQKELNTLEEKQKEFFIWKDQINEIMRVRPADRDFDKEISDINKQLIQLMTIPMDACPKCGFINPELQANQDKRIKYLEDEMTVREEQKKELIQAQADWQLKLLALGQKEMISSNTFTVLKFEIEELQKYEKQLIEVNSLDKVREDIRGEIESLEKEQIQLRSKKLDLEVELKDRGMYDTMLSKIMGKIKMAEKEKEEVVNKQRENFAKFTVAKNALENIEKNKKELQELIEKGEKLGSDIDALQLVKEAFSASGIKAIVVDMLIPRLEDVINQTLEKLSDFRIRLETQKSGTGKDTVLEGLFIIIINSEGEELGIENMSGGESVKISSAIFEGLASISNCSFRVLDETVIGLDPETISSFAEIMLQLKESVNQLICVSHLTEIQELFEQKIEVVKINGTSKTI